MPQVNVDVNLTVEVPQEEIDALMGEIDDSDDDSATLDEMLPDILEHNLFVSYSFGDAWVCSVDNASLI